MKKYLLTIKNIKIYLIILSLFEINCNNNTITSIPKKMIPKGTVIIQSANTIQGNIKLIVDNMIIPVKKEYKQKKYTKIIINGLKPGIHQFIVLSSSELFGPTEFSINLNNIHGEYKIILSRPYQFNLSSTDKKFLSNNITTHIAAQFEK